MAAAVATWSPGDANASGRGEFGREEKALGGNRFVRLRRVDHEKMIRRGLWKQPSAANASAMPNNIGFAEKAASGSRTEACLTLHFRQLLVPGHGNKRSQSRRGRRRG